MFTKTVLFLIFTLFLILLLNYNFLLPTAYADTTACIATQDQCISDCNLNYPDSHKRDNCINDCVQAKDRCIGKPTGGVCRDINPVVPVNTTSIETDNNLPDNQTAVTLVWQGQPDPDPVNGGCDGKGRNLTLYIGSCPDGTTVFDPNICSSTPKLLPISKDDASKNQTTATMTVGTHYWYVHSECNCGKTADSDKRVFYASPPPCGSSKEEKAVCNQKHYLLPNQIADNPSVEEQNFFTGVKTFLQDILANLFFPPPPRKIARMYNQSNNLDQSNVPDQVKPNNPVSFNLTDPVGSLGNAVKNFAGYLGEKNGVYCVDMPDQLKASEANTEAIKKCEQYYEQTNFPEGVHPITP